MNYEGKLYGCVGGEYFPLLETTEDVDKLKADLEAVKEELKRSKRRNKMLESEAYIKEGRDGYEHHIKVVEAENERLRGLLKVAECPNKPACDGKGTIAGQNPYTGELIPEPCEWCHTYQELLNQKRK